MDYYNASGDTVYKAAAEEGIRNCFCLFTEDGEGSCAYVYPYRVNDRKGEFYDDWANDQDFALYFYDANSAAVMVWGELLHERSD